MSENIKTQVDIREFTDKDFAFAAALDLAIWEEKAGTEEIWRHQAEMWEEKFLLHRVIMELDGQPVGYGSIMEPFWSYRAGKYRVGCMVHPEYRGQGVATTFWEYAQAVIETLEPQADTLTTSTRENQAEALAWIEKLGFALVMRYPTSTLHLDQFDGAQYRELREKVEASGVEIKTLADVKATIPNWKTKLIDMIWEVWQDVPSADPPQRPDPETFEKLELSGPDFLLEGYFVAVDGDQLVGLTTLRKMLGHPEYLHTDITGVVRSHRRRGIAKALKVHAVEFALDYGVQFVTTDNEENNPMFQINLQLGFQPDPAWVEFEKSV